MLSRQRLHRMTLSAAGSPAMLPTPQPTAQPTVLPTAQRYPLQRLCLARTVAWALLLGGWLVLGTLGRQQLPQSAGGQLPVALWLATLAGALALAGHWRASVLALRSGLLASGLAAALALAWPDRSAALLLCAAVAWALLLVAASLVVRGLRRLQPGPAPTPTGPALAGAVLAWAVAGDLDALRHGVVPVVWALGLAALALALLLPLRVPAGAAAPAAGARRGVGFGACRAGLLFDCALPLLRPGRWRDLAAWPQAAAALAMLPMMASLPAMADWCGDLRWPAAAGTALHLGAMLLPAALLQAWPMPLQRLQRGVALLLVLGGAALAWPGLSGLMVASLLHGLAWGVAWAAMLAPGAGRCAAVEAVAAAATLPTLPTLAMLGAALLTSGAVLLLGQALAQSGPAALVAVHGVLAGLGWVGGLAGLRGHSSLPRPVAHPG